MSPMSLQRTPHSSPTLSLYCITYTSYGMCHMWRVYILYIRKVIPRCLINSIRRCARDFLCNFMRSTSTNTYIVLRSALRWPCHENGIKNALLIKSTLCAAMNWVNLQIRIRIRQQLQMPLCRCRCKCRKLSSIFPPDTPPSPTFLSGIFYRLQIEQEIWKKLLAFDLILRPAAFVANKNDMAKEAQRKKERWK